MFQGTASNVGKSLIATGICKILTEDGYDVVPFKPQNMSLNSYIDIDGKEMGRAQVMQAIASNKIPRAYMNPILLKPCGNHISQVIFMGDVVANMESKKYQEYKKELVLPLKTLFDKLEDKHDVVVIEGAGSPAEININQLDLSNMKMAEISNSPVVLVADIDRGGVFASILGTIMLLKDDEKKRVKGIIVNKFRGNKEYFREGVKKIEEITGIDVLGVVPYFSVNLDEEDGVSHKFNGSNYVFDEEYINIDVIKYPHMSNYTDFEVFNFIEKVNLRYIDVRSVESDKKLKLKSDILILPGSKNTVEDIRELKLKKLDQSIKEYIEEGGIAFGICGGYQILGNKILDYSGIDSGRYEYSEEQGLGVFDYNTVFSDEKITRQTKFEIKNEGDVFEGLNGYIVDGYELHMGRDEEILSDNNEVECREELPYKVKKRVLATYVHGFFDNIQMSATLINNIRRMKGLEEIEIPKIGYEELKIKEYEKISKILRENLDIEKIYEIIFRK